MRIGPNYNPFFTYGRFVSPLNGRSLARRNDTNTVHLEIQRGCELTEILENASTLLGATVVEVTRRISFELLKRLQLCSQRGRVISDWKQLKHGKAYVALCQGESFPRKPSSEAVDDGGATSFAQQFA